MSDNDNDISFEINCIAWQIDSLKGQYHFLRALFECLIEKVPEHGRYIESAYPSMTDGLVGAAAALRLVHDRLSKVSHA